MNILKIESRLILNSLGLRTIEVELFTSNGYKEFSSRVKLNTQKFLSEEKILETCNFLDTFIDKALKARDFKSQFEFDEYILKLSQDSKVEDIAVRGVSLAFAEAFAKSLKKRQFEYFASLFNVIPKVPRLVISKEEGFYELATDYDAETFLTQYSNFKQEKRSGFVELKKINEYLKDSPSLSDFLTLKDLINTRPHALSLKDAGTEEKVHANIAIGSDIAILIIPFEYGVEVISKLNELTRIERIIKNKP